MILAAFLLAGCAADNGKTEFSFAVFGDPAELQAYQDLVAAFHEAHPEIQVNLRHTASQSEYRQRLATEFSAGSASDVMLLNYRRFARFAGQGALEPLGPYLAESGLVAVEDFFDVTIDSFMLDDTLWCIPQNISSLVVYYNRDLFNAAGVPYPTAGWSREDFVTTAAALTKDTDGDGRIDQFGVGLAPSIFRLAPFIWQDGGDLVDDPENPTRLILDQSPQIDTFRWFVSLQTEAGVVPDAVSEAAESSENRFLNGTLGMYFNSRRGVPTYRTIESFAWDVVPLPEGSLGAAGILHSDAYCMAASTENKDAAWTFIEFANSTVGQSIVVVSGRTVPSLVAVAESDGFLEPGLPPANSQAWIDVIPTLGRVPTMTGWVGVEETAGIEIEKAFYGQVSVEEAAAAAVEQTLSFFQDE